MLTLITLDQVEEEETLYSSPYPVAPETADQEMVALLAVTLELEALPGVGQAVTKEDCKYALPRLEQLAFTRQS